jgi:hypothetical protein
MFIIVPFIGVIVATWRTVLQVLGDGPSTRIEVQPADAEVPP